MSDLVTFLRARLDEDEAVARRAIRRAGTWHAVPDRKASEGYQGVPALLVDADTDRDAQWSLNREVIAGGDDSFPSSDDAGWLVHAARHDPVRVLAEVAAKRQILQRYEQLTADLARNRAASDELAADIDREERGEPVVGHTDVRGRAIGREHDYLTAMLGEYRQVLRLLAEPHASHPDYDPSWKLA